MSLRKQLCDTASDAGFSVQDVATWLEYGFSTVHNWMNGVHDPYPTKQKHVAARLKLLRKVLGNKTGGLPVPPTVTQYERKAYIEGIRDRALKGIFREGAAR